MPSRIAGRNFFFCSSVPYTMSVGPTVLSVTSGIGALTRCASSKKMNCSSAVNPRPPYSLGQPTPSRLAAPSARTHSLTASPPSMRPATAAMRSGVITVSSEARISARSSFCSGVKSRCIAQRPVPSRTGMRLTPGTIVARIRSTSPTSSSLGYRPSNTSKKTRASSRAS